MINSFFCERSRLKTPRTRRCLHRQIILFSSPKIVGGDIPQRVAGDRYDGGTRAVRFRVSGLIPKGDWSHSDTKRWEKVETGINTYIRSVRNMAVRNVVRDIPKVWRRKMYETKEFRFNGDSRGSTHQIIQAWLKHWRNGDGFCISLYPVQIYANVFENLISTAISWIRLT